MPLGVSKIKVTAYGASAGAKGGMAEGIISVTPGEILYLFVGGSNGWNGGGSGGPGTITRNGSNGGGASDMRRGGNNSSNRVIVAGGAGGNSGVDGWGTTVSLGGIGGGVSGDNGVNSVNVANGGGGGSNVAGGTAGGNGSAGDSTSLGYGGIGGNAYSTNCSGDCAANWQGGGGGGGGYHGGGGGGGFTSSEKYTACQGGGGGGGSSLIPPGGTTQAGVWSGNGRIIIMASEVSSYPNISEWQDGSGNVLSAININGNFGIGTATPSAALDIASGKTTLADAWSTRSSLRFKENLYPIDNALNKIASLQGVYFDYKDSHKHSLGLVAEDVGKVFPELVTYETNGQDAISLDYDKLGAVTIEAIKEQQKEIETQREEITQLRNLLKETSRHQQKEIELLKAEKKAGS